MELALHTDGLVASLRVIGRMEMAETGTLSEYLRVARENGAVRCIVDFADCAEAPTTLLSVLIRESARFVEAGGALILSGVSDQNPFLTQVVLTSRFPHYRTLEEAWSSERDRAASAIDAPPTVT